MKSAQPRRVGHFSLMLHTQQPQSKWSLHYAVPSTGKYKINKNLFHKFLFIFLIHVWQRRVAAIGWVFCSLRCCVWALFVDALVRIPNTPGYRDPAPSVPPARRGRRGDG